MIIIEPVVEQEHHVIDQSIDFIGLNFGGGLLAESRPDRVYRGLLELEDAAESALQRGVAFQQVSEVSVQETVVVHFLEHHVEVEPVVFDAQRLVDRRNENFTQPLLELVEELGDDDVLALEVVIEVTGADIHFVGDIYRGGMGFALVVEQQQAGVEYPVPGFHSV